RDQVALDPAREAPRERGDDDLVERALGERLLDGPERLGTAKQALDLRLSGPPQPRQRDLERPVRRPPPAPVPDQQRAAAAARLHAAPDLVEQLRRGRGAIRDDEDARDALAHVPTFPRHKPPGQAIASGSAPRRSPE